VDDLTGFFELIDASEIQRGEGVDRVLRAYLAQPGCRGEGVMWDSAFRMPMVMSGAWYDTEPVSLAGWLREVVPHLGAGEYLYFELKEAASGCLEASSLQAVLVTSSGVRVVCGGSLRSELFEEAGL
jgi:hypothetical protein